MSLSFSVTSFDHNADWRKIAAAIAQRANPGDLVLVYKSHGASLLKRYYKGDLELQGVTYDFDVEIKQRESENYLPGSHYRPFFSQDVLGRLDQLVERRERFFMVFFPLSNNQVIKAREFMLTRYAVNEMIMLNESQILILSEDVDLHS